MQMRCRTAQRWIPRGLAGELSSRRLTRLERHLERCEGCRREQAAYAALDRALGLLPMTAALSPRLEQDTLRRVRVAAGGSEPRRGRRWVFVAAPALAAAGALVIALQAGAPPDMPAAPAAKTPPPPAPRVNALAQVTRRAPAPPPSPAPHAPAPRRRTVPSDPPPELAARPDLFINLPMLRNLDKLQHYDAIETTTLDGQRGDQSNG